MVEYEYLRQEINAIDNQIKQLQEHHESLVIAREALNSIEGEKDSELLVPGGAGVYFNATLTNDESCLVNVGANVIIEMNLDKGKKTINERIEQALSMIVELNEEADKRVNQLRQIEAAVQGQQLMQ